MKLFRVQFSLVALLVGITAVSLGCVSLAFASPVWSSIVFSVCLMVILFSMLAAIFRRGDARAFWIGFLLFGSAYLVLVCGPWFDTNIKHRLLSSRILGFAHRFVAPAGDANVLEGLVITDINSDGFADLYVDNSSSQQMYKTYTQLGNGILQAGGNARLVSNSSVVQPPWDEFQQVGHSVFAMLCAIVGGYLACVLIRAQRNSESKGKSTP